MHKESTLYNYVESHVRVAWCAVREHETSVVASLVVVLLPIYNVLSFVVPSCVISVTVFR